MPQGRASIPVYIEAGAKRVFACTLDWPGWTRAARSEELALAALEEYAQRYAPIAKAARLPLPPVFTLRVRERIQGTATTDFGAPDCIPDSDTHRLPSAEAERLVSLMQAAWLAFDRAVSDAPSTLRKGPRGGGRDRDAIADHVLGGEHAYARKIGVRHPQPAHDDRRGIESLRATLVAACLTPSKTQPAWPVRYFIRRLTWHALDHLWEIEDRS